MVSLIPYLPNWLAPYIPFLLQLGLLVTLHMIVSTFVVSALEGMVGAMTDKIPVGQILQYTVVDYLLLAGTYMIAGRGAGGVQFWVAALFLIAHFTVKVYEDDSSHVAMKLSRRKALLGAGLLHMLLALAWWFLAVTNGTSLLVPAAQWLLNQGFWLLNLPYHVGTFIAVIGLVLLAQLFVRLIFALIGLTKLFGRTSRDELTLGIR